jgi:hypothetical protein
MIAPLIATVAAFALQSADIQNGAAFPPQFKAVACGGGNTAPELAWTNAPAAAKSFALVLWDPDAPISGGFYHWLLYDIPVTTHEIAQNAIVKGADAGKNSTGQPGYFGPCPPQGPPHHYVFTLYALDLKKLGDGASLNAGQLAAAIRGHVVAKAELRATATR